MRLEIAERMRCPRPHAPTPLVIVARRVDGRELVRGVAGCPVCGLEAEVRDGDVRFPGAPGAPGGPGRSPAASAPEAAPGAAPGALDRLRALLLLAESGGAVLVAGRYAAFAAPVAEAVDVAVVVLSPDGVTAAPPSTSAAVSAVWLVERVVPFSDHTFRAAALDGALGPELAADAVRCVAVGGRVVGSAALALPANVRELARDGEEWVGEREAGPGGVVRIRRA